MPSTPHPQLTCDTRMSHMWIRHITYERVPHVTSHTSWPKSNILFQMCERAVIEADCNTMKNWASHCNTIFHTRPTRHGPRVISLAQMCGRESREVNCNSSFHPNLGDKMIRLLVVIPPLNFAVSSQTLQHNERLSNTLQHNEGLCNTLQHNLLHSSHTSSPTSDVTVPQCSTIGTIPTYM